MAVFNGLTLNMQGVYKTDSTRLVRSKANGVSSAAIRGLPIQALTA